MEDGEQCGRTGTFLLIKLLQFYFPVVQNLHLIGKHKVPQFYCTRPDCINFILLPESAARCSKE